ncbi:MAG: response regulator [Bryobacterales bacterium]|nr:response regulator [Bryobacterales bacterium]
MDDNRHGLQARKLILEELGYRTATAGDPVEGLAVLEGQQFDIVVTDYRMPHMTGVEFVQKLRESRPDMPAILVSGFVDVLGLTEENTGCNVVIQKSPNEVTQLVRAVARLVKQAKPVRKPSGPAPGTARKRKAQDAS